MAGERILYFRTTYSFILTPVAFLKLYPGCDFYFSICKVARFSRHITGIIFSVQFLTSW